MEDHMTIGSGLVEYIISKAIKKYIRKKTNKPDMDFAFIFNSPLKIDNDGMNVNMDLNVKIAMTYKDLMDLIKNSDF